MLVQLASNSPSFPRVPCDCSCLFLFVLPRSDTETKPWHTLLEAVDSPEEGLSLPCGPPFSFSAKARAVLWFAPGMPFAGGLQFLVLSCCLW